MMKKLMMAVLLAAGVLPLATTALAAEARVCMYLKRAYPGTGVPQAEATLRDAQNGGDKLAIAEAMYALAEARHFSANIKGGDELVKQANDIWKAMQPTVPLAQRVQAEAKKLMDAGDCRTGATTLRTALSIAERATPVDDAATYSILTDLALSDAAARNLTGMRQYGQRLTDYWQKNGEPADGITAPVYSRMVELYLKDEQVTQALPLALRNLQNGEKQYGAEHGALIPRLDDLASLYYAQLRYAEGEAATERAAAIYQKINPRGGGRFGLSTQQKIEIEMRRRYSQGDAAGALALGEQEIKQLEQKLEIDQQALQVAIKASEQEQVAAKRVALAEAERRAQARVMSAERPLAAMRNRVAELFHAQKRYQQAQALYLQAIESYARSSADPLEAAAAKSSLATLYRTQGNLDDAMRLQGEALELLLPAFGPVHPDVIDSANELALIYQRQGKTAEIAALAERVQSLRKR